MFGNEDKMLTCRRTSILHSVQYLSTLALLTKTLPTLHQPGLTQAQHPPINHERCGKGTRWN